MWRVSAPIPEAGLIVDIAGAWAIAFGVMWKREEDIVTETTTFRGLQRRPAREHRQAEGRRAGRRGPSYDRLRRPVRRKYRLGAILGALVVDDSGSDRSRSGRLCIPDVVLAAPQVCLASARLPMPGDSAFQ